ncbi:MAG: TrkH family potassium uptake protein [Candidatus Sumerlaeia bacterium]
MNYFAVLRHIGLLVSIQGLLMLTSVYWALYYRDGCAGSILAAAALTLAGGGAMFAVGRLRRQEVYRREALAIVGVSWLLAAAFGALPFMLTGSVSGFVDGFFEAMSGFTTTGSTILTDIEAVPKSVLWWRSFTHWLGGMGIVVLFLAILPILGAGGKHLYKNEVPGLIEDALTPKIRETAVILWKIYLVFTVAETLLLMSASSRMTLFEALCHTFGTLATGGFSTKNASVGYFNSLAVELIIILFMFLAGVNFTLHFRVWRERGKLSSYWSDPEWRTYTGLIAAATMLVALQLRLAPQMQDSYGGWGRALRDAAFQVVSIITTTGYGTADFNQWPPGSKALLVALMFVGGCGGSTGGGLKVIRWLTLVKIARNQIERVYQPHRVRPLRIGAAIIDQDLQMNTMIYFFIAIFIFVAATIAVSFSGTDVVTSATAVAATMNNIGPGLERVGAIENYAFFHPWVKVLLSILMVIGRLELFSILVLFIPRFWK